MISTKEKEDALRRNFHTLPNIPHIPRKRLVRSKNPYALWLPTGHGGKDTGHQRHDELGGSTGGLYRPTIQEVLGLDEYEYCIEETEERD